MSASSLPIPYTKPHLSYNEQLALLKSRGLACDHDADGLQLLKALGYYNLSGYLYPFRERAADGRADRFVSGTTLSDVLDVVDFDRRLRSLLLEGIPIVEVGARAQIAYVLGERDPFGHTDPTSLDATACARVPKGGQRTKFQHWICQLDRLREQRAKEPFMQHNIHKYGTSLPIWIDCEVLDFGSVANLFELLNKDDRERVSSDLGAPKARLLDSWLRSLNYVRNICAHNARLWNRVLVVKPSVQRWYLPDDLKHLDLRERPGMRPTNDRPYVPIALVAFLAQRIRADVDWASRMRGLLLEFEAMPHRSAAEIGLPMGWRYEPLWAHQRVRGARS